MKVLSLVAQRIKMKWWMEAESDGDEESGDGGKEESVWGEEPIWRELVESVVMVVEMM